MNDGAGETLYAVRKPHRRTIRKIMEAAVGLEPTKSALQIIQFIAYPATFHAATPPFSTLTLVKPCS